MKTKIKNTIIIYMFVFILLLLESCSSQLYLKKRTDRLIEKSHKNADTVFLYSLAFNDFNLIWYHKDDYIYSFGVKPHKTIKYEPIEAENIPVSSDSISKYFNASHYKGTQCFELTLDGEWIKLYVKGEDSAMTSVDTHCLINTKFEPNSFPYKLQYDFSRMQKPMYFDFDEMYSK